MDVNSITTKVVYKRTEKGTQTGEVDIFNLDQGFRLETGDVELAEQLNKKSSQLIQDGIEFHSHAPEFYYSKLEDDKLELLAQAADNARERAKSLTGGDRMHGILSASQGVFQVTEPLSTETSKPFAAAHRA